MARNKVDVLAIDSAHDIHRESSKRLELSKAKLPEIDLLAGNVGTFDGACELVKGWGGRTESGIGPGSICTTRSDLTGRALPQITAIAEAYRA